jgi:quinol monooxygenase YgiN
MVISLLKINPQPGKRKTIRDLLHYSQGFTRINMQCLNCSVYEDSDSQSILYVEQWQSREALHEHIKSSSYMSLLTAMELSVTPPEITFVEPIDTEGMELIESLRLD